MMVRQVSRHKFSCKREVGSSGVESGTYPLFPTSKPAIHVNLLTRRVRHTLTTPERRTRMTPLAQGVGH